MLCQKNLPDEVGINIPKLRGINQNTGETNHNDEENSVAVVCVESRWGRGHL